MTPINNGCAEHRNIVDEVRAARAAVAREAGGLDGLGEYLRRIQEEYRSRTGRFADVPTDRSQEVERLIDAAETDAPLLDEIRATRAARKDG